MKHGVWLRLATAALCAAAACGCGTTKWTDTRRTATEQVLLSSAMDRAVSRLDFRALAGKDVYLDPQFIKTATDSEYLISALRQHMLASGCVLRDKKDDADYVVEVRVGAIGTDRNELLFGVPATELPSLLPLAGVPRAVPEMPFVKKTEQRGVARIALFAYNSHTGRPLWQSGTIPVESTAKDLWVLGAGPFQRGSIYDGTQFAGDKLTIPLIDPLTGRNRDEAFSVSDEAYFSEPIERDDSVVDAAEANEAPAAAKQAAAPKPARSAAGQKPKGADTVPDADVAPAGHTEVVEDEDQP